jgi:hypothetical protein
MALNGRQMALNGRQMALNGRQMDGQMTPSNPSNDAFELNRTMYLDKQSLSFTVIIIIFTS